MVRVNLKQTLQADYVDAAKARGTGVTYSGVRTTSKGLLTQAKIEKKTLLGG